MIELTDLLTLAQVRAVLPLPRSTLHALCASGRLPHYRVTAVASRRGRILVARADLEAFLASARVARPSAPTRDAAARAHVAREVVS